MQPESTEKALNSVIKFCESIIMLEERQSDETIETAEKVLKIIRKELN
ncbi:hypothetical protein [Mesobacillus sp. S13]|nr:hypothetical protein [Mesobacillus sp. S13]